MRRLTLLTTCLAGALVLGGGTAAMADPPALQFTDQEYLENGIDPSLPDPVNPLNPFNRPPANFDQFLLSVATLDGVVVPPETPGSVPQDPEILVEFLCLQETGDFCE